jgi:hypothetical protein
LRVFSFNRNKIAHKLGYSRRALALKLSLYYVAQLKNVRGVYDDLSISPPAADDLNIFSLE